MLAASLQTIRIILPGVSAAFLVGLLAMFLSDYFGIPVMLIALVLGMTLHTLYKQNLFYAGINFTTTTVLRSGVALLGLRITFDQVLSLGLGNLLVMSAAVAATLLFGSLLAVRLRRSPQFGLLTGGSVAICGASAALAIATVLPPHPERERQVVFTVLCVTALSTIAMVLYPFIVELFDLSAQAAGFFLGGTIHDVAQVVGAGYSVSEEVGDYATITKLYRVLMLIPVFVFLALAFRARGDALPGKLPKPWFILGFVLFLVIGSYAGLPESVLQGGIELSRLCLVVAITALGMKTNLAVLFKGSLPALLLVIAETLWLAVLILAWVLLSQ